MPPDQRLKYVGLRRRKFCQGIDRIPRKSAYRFCDDQVDFSGEGILGHGLESGSLPDACAGDSFVGVDLYKFPVLSGLDIVGVVVDLCFVACELVVMVCRNAGVSGNAPFFLLEQSNSNKILLL